MKLLVNLMLPLALSQDYPMSLSSGSLICDNVSGAKLIPEVCKFLRYENSPCHFEGSPEQESEYHNEMAGYKEKFCTNLSRQATPPPISQRGLSGDIQLSQFLPDFENIRQYGCWCDFDSYMIKGHGSPVNDVDKTCHDLNMGYKCINHDNENEFGTECRPETSEYSVASVMNKNMIEIICQYANMFKPAPKCAQRLCVVESHFLMWFIEKSLDTEYRFDPAMIRDTNGGTFVYEEQCFGNSNKQELGTGIEEEDVGTGEQIDYINSDDDADLLAQYDDGSWFDFSNDDEHSFIDSATDGSSADSESREPNDQVTATECADCTSEQNQVQTSVTNSATSNETPQTPSSSQESSTTTQATTTNSSTSSTTTTTTTSTTTTTTTTALSELKCCGFYPKRFPYHESSGKSCCNNQVIYDVSSKSCCNGDTLKDVGTC